MATRTIRLTAAQLADYHSTGFVRLGRVMSPAVLAAMRREEARFRQSPQYSLSDRKTVLPDTSTIFRNQLSNHSAVVRRMFLQGPHLPAVQQILGPIVCGNFTQFVTKLPDPDLATATFPWHQDNGYGGKHSARHVTVWCALDDVDEHNGCVWVVPGSHRQGLLPHRTSGTSWHLTVTVEGNGEPVRLRAGEAVAFTGFTLHRSLANHSAAPRRAFFMEYGDFISDHGPDGAGLQPTPLWMIAGELPYPTPPEKT